MRAVAELDEPEHVNPLRARVLRDEQALRRARAWRRRMRPRARAFASSAAKPGRVRRGLCRRLIDRRTGATARPGAEPISSGSGYAYGAADGGAPAARRCARSLSRVDAVLQNQDNREHDVLDSDDYYQFQGGAERGGRELAARAAGGALPRRPPHPRRRASARLREELRACACAAACVNPKWIAGARRHGYRGAAEMAATVGLSVRLRRGDGRGRGLPVRAASATPTCSIAENRAFLGEHNPSALREMTERLLEADAARHVARNRAHYRAALEALLLDAEEGAA